MASTGGNARFARGKRRIVLRRAGNNMTDLLQQEIAATAGTIVVKVGTRTS